MTDEFVCQVNEIKFIDMCIYVDHTINGDLWQLVILSTLVVGGYSGIDDDSHSMILSQFMFSMDVMRATNLEILE